MARFFEAEFYHLGKKDWIAGAFNSEAIEMAQPDEKMPDHSRVWFRSDTGVDAGLLLRLTWAEMRCALGCVQK